MANLYKDNPLLTPYRGEGIGLQLHPTLQHSEKGENGLNLLNRDTVHCYHSPSSLNLEHSSLNDINLQLHASSVGNPYSFSIKNNVSFSSPSIAVAKSGIVKVYGSSPWYSSNWYDASKVSNLATFTGGAQFKVTGATDCRYMFESTKLTKVDLSNLDTSRVIYMSDMFRDCGNLMSINLSNFDTSNVTKMSYMFRSCTKLTSIDLSSFNTSKVTSMDRMFGDCNNLPSVNLSSFDTSKVTSMDYMFQNCTKLTSVGSPVFSVSKPYSLYKMFDGCHAFTSPIHFKNVRSRLITAGSSPSNWEISSTSGIRGVHYVVDSVISG